MQATPLRLKCSTHRVRQRPSIRKQWIQTQSKKHFELFYLKPLWFKFFLLMQFLIISFMYFNNLTKLISFSNIAAPLPLRSLKTQEE